MGDVADVVRRGRVVRAIDAEHHVAAVLAPRAGVAELERGSVCERLLGRIASNNRWHGEDESEATEELEDEHSTQGSFEPQLRTGGFLCRCGLVSLVVVGNERDEVSTCSEQ